MYSRQDLEQEINNKIKNGAVSARWITMQVCAMHTVGEYDPHESHATLCQFHHTRDVTGKLLAKFVKTNAPKQIEFAGEQFTRIQQQYIVERDDDEVAVSVFDMTDAEIDAIADRLYFEGHAKIEHALELRAFKAARIKTG